MADVSILCSSAPTPGPGRAFRRADSGPRERGSRDSGVPWTLASCKVCRWPCVPSTYDLDGSLNCVLVELRKWLATPCTATPRPGYTTIIILQLDGIQVKLIASAPPAIFITSMLSFSTEAESLYPPDRIRLVHYIRECWCQYAPHVPYREP